ncbi:hypothetical protein NQ317_016229 [Molorchus minor]|uniref:Uncharacterized protein n=1 Tax=Molorchus minor TaxID=1323400 RepID=A0ABQ9JEC7_9CUCU|nr:hypothetical protein NQ317_016229 [Molorchus minor]
MCGPGKTKNRAPRNHFESGLLGGKSSLFLGAITIRAWGVVTANPVHQLASTLACRIFRLLILKAI